MTAPSTLLAEPAAPAPVPRAPNARSRDSMAVRTRFGTVAVERERILEMPLGPLGFAQHREFALTDLPNPRLDSFKLLQSLADPEVSFVVTQIEPSQGLIDPADIEAGCQAAGLDPLATTVWLIVTVRSAEGGVAMSANLRAPLLLDPLQRTGRQVVLANPRYSIRHPI